MSGALQAIIYTACALTVLCAAGVALYVHFTDAPEPENPGRHTAAGIRSAADDRWADTIAAPAGPEPWIGVQVGDVLMPLPLPGLPGEYYDAEPPGWLGPHLPNVRAALWQPRPDPPATPPAVELRPAFIPAGQPAADDTVTDMRPVPATAGELPDLVFAQLDGLTPSQYVDYLFGASL
jgi:hypothetical protein